MADPYNTCMSFAPQLIPFPYMTNIITDSHEVARDRMGRSAVFLARMYKDFGFQNPIGVAVDEETDIALSPNGVGVAWGTGTAYIIKLSSPLQSFVCENRTPVTIVRVDGVRLDTSKGDTYNFVTGATTGTSYNFNITNGVIQGNPYGPGLFPTSISLSKER
eukprot:TRINITY_DN5310_c0_g1_i13.p1 TRINITY_DN5310_c0_g1~~TRINITY_DN5310_c0_g1_i13.p1  ORF type:complete len:162 (-),score=13.64 TRINITY_DN5310_c0_g1_i13:84-569(-)